MTPQNTDFPLWEVRSHTAAADAFAPLSAVGERKIMSLGLILLIVFIVLMLGALPTWPHSRSWGYYPSGSFGLLLLILVVLVLTRTI
jgi:hypothetical protein